jgi:hypothetical protein
MKYAISLSSLLVAALSVLPALAADTDSSLQNGGAVTVDPNTNRATITRDGVATPLWDGTHRLQDGSILIIREGISVPTEPAPGTRLPPIPKAAEWEGAPIVGHSPCEKLVHRVCGEQGRCRDNESCNLARQLLTMEQDERAASENRNRMTYTSGECHEVNADRELFPSCK